MPAKSVKLEQAVYNRLDETRTKDETFSQVVERLLDIASLLVVVSRKLEGVSDED